MNQWPRVKELFHGALEREPAERAAFLNASCGDEGAVRSEVERLLAAHEQTGAFIEQSPVGMAGRVIGHYKIERSVGAGGMGEVYVARDLELGRTVAVKIAHGTDDDAHARLKREAQHASQLNHPNICTIHEIGVFDGQPFIAMEFVDGQRLNDRIPPGGLPVGEVVRCGVQIAGALAHAHLSGVVHRDLKSANVMLTSDGRVKVLDFGLARRHSADRLKDLSLSRDSLTGHELAAGTLSCMAPELLRGGTADARSDIWALGVLLYEMATGTRPFAGATGFELSGAILHEPPAPLPNQISPSLKQIILRCLEKDPGRRYQQAEDVCAALESSGPHERSSRVRRAMTATAVALLVIAALAAVPFFVWRAMKPSPVSAVSAPGPHAIAVMNFENVAGAEDLAWLSKGVPRMLVTGLAQTSGLYIVSAQHLDEAARKMGGTTVDVLSSAEFADIARRSGAGAVVSGTIMKAGEEVRVDVQLHDLSSGRVLAAETARGTDVFALADHLTARIRTAAGFSDSASIRSVADVSSSSLEAYRLYSEGVDACLNVRWADAQKLLEAAIEKDPRFAEAYLQLAVVASSRGSPVSRREYLRKAAEYADRLSAQQRRLLDLQLARGTGDPAKAARLLEAFLADYPTVEEAYGAANSLYNPALGGVFDPEKMLSVAQMGVKALPTSGPTRNTYGYALINAGRYGDALREFETYARLAPREPNPYDSMGEAYLFLGLPDKAVESYSRALSIDATFDSARNGQALGLAMLGRYEEAIAINPVLAAEKTILLSRVGRYREAAQAKAGRQSADLGIDAFRDGTLHVLAAMLSLERHDAARAAREAASAERVFEAADHPRRQTYMVLTHLIAGLAAIQNGNIADARSRLDRQKQFYRPEYGLDVWLHKALEGEIALATGDTQLAAAAFSKGEPGQKYFHSDRIGVTLVTNHLPSRDGLARVAKARGDLAAAIAIYRRLQSSGSDSKWVSALEPRYVLELARLLEKTGDTQSALSEYERFLDLWKRADPELPELSEARRAIARLRQSRSG